PALALAVKGRHDEDVAAANALEGADLVLAILEVALFVTPRLDAEAGRDALEQRLPARQPEHREIRPRGRRHATASDSARRARSSSCTTSSSLTWVKSWYQRPIAKRFS